MKKQNELDRIVNLVSNSEEQSIRIALEELKNYIGKDRMRLLLIEAQLRTWHKNTDFNFHLSLVALVASVIAIVITVAIEVAGSVSNGQILSFVVMICEIVMMLLVIIYSTCIICKIYKHMKCRRYYDYVEIALEEYKNEFQGKKGKHK